MGQELRDDQPWWDDFYDDMYADMVLVGDPEQTREVIDALLTLLGLGPSPMRIFDQCCGVGRWGLELAMRGHEVVGVDIIGHYIERANKTASSLHIADRCSFFAADARQYLAPAPGFDLAINWYTSFGYSPKDEDNLAMLVRAYESLRPGGIFAMECGNMARILSTFQPTMSYRHQGPQGQILVVRESSLELEDGMLSQRWTFVLPTGELIERPSSIKMYLPHQLRALVQAAGFSQIKCYGDLQGQPLNAQSPRCIITAIKPS